MEIEEKKSVEILAKEYLQKEGIEYTDLFDDGNMFFKYQGAGFYFDIDKEDPNFFRLVMPSIYKIDNDRIKVLETMLLLTGKKKALKAELGGDHVWLSIEMFIDPNSNLDIFSEHMKRSLDILHQGRLELLARLDMS